MKCPHCGVEAHFHFVVEQFTYGRGRALPYQYRSAFCPSPKCKKLVIQYKYQSAFASDDDESWIFLIPSAPSRGTIPAEVPSPIADDYQEACNVLAISPKASAALSRRCLQAILRSNGYKAKDLAKEIELLLNEPETSKAIPADLRSIVDAIRHFGNFSAHPVNDVTTLQVIDVEPHEAEWCLEVLEECFQHFYVRPAQAAARKAALDAKLALAGKPASKG